MRWSHFILLVLAAVHAKEEETNEVSPLRPPINLDANLRRALLKALTELENEENEKSKQPQQTDFNLPQIDTRDKVVEKASAAALSFFATTGTSTVTTTEKFQTTTDEENSSQKSVVIIQRSNGLQHKPVNSVENNRNYQLDPVSEPEQILTSASSSFTSSNKFSYSKSDSQASRTKNLLNNEVKSTKIETTTPTTTTTSTEENEAKVEDVQFFSAPLVAAFTVHQDERGVPKSVEPIYKSAVKPGETKETTRFKQEKLVENQQLLLKQEQLIQEQQQRDRLNTQLALHEKQKALEEEIFRLKHQQQQQNYLIRQQQLLHEQQLQLQRQKLLEEQIRVRNNQQNFVPLANNFAQQNQPQTDFNSNNSRVKGSLVSFQPSITFNSEEQFAGVLPANARHLPVKNAVDFRLPFVQQSNFNEFNYQQQLSGNSPTFSLSQSVEPPRHNRVFRQESGTGNFFNDGFNNNYYNQLSAQEQSNRFFRSNPEQYSSNRLQPPVVNQQLNHLLYNSGIGRGRQQEDLSIVSKVLSLNHFGDNRFGSSNVNEQRVPFVKKV